MDDREEASVVDGEVSDDFVEAAVTRTEEDEGEREDGLVAFLRRACATAGKDERRAEEVAKRLREQWFETVEDVLEMTVEDARAVGMPMRLWRACAETAAADEDEDEDEDEDDEDDAERRSETNA